jgi:AcrR family transcriptional regulator
MAIRSTRDRPAKAPLSEAAIVDAALAITKAEGFEAVTMRRIAAELDTGAASLYVYVRNRDELLQAMFDRAVDPLALVEPDPKRWREQVHDLLGTFLGRCRATPAWPAPCRSARRPRKTRSPGRRTSSRSCSRAGSRPRTRPGPATSSP